MSKNSNLTEAKKNKNDEFYTQLSDIEKELTHYTDKLKGKIIYCNCDNPKWSNFYKYFKDNFSSLGIKKLISTYYSETEKVYKTVFDGTKETKEQLKGNGDFRSDECLKLLKDSDIVVTNPPFSLFREFISVLMKYKKQFLVIGNKNAIAYKDFFPLVKNNKVWIGYSFPNEFKLPDGSITKKLDGLTRWFTNIDHEKRREMLPLDLSKVYEGHEDMYPKYDNYDAINIDRISEIPCDYEGVMGVPITFLDKYCPKQFEIVIIACGHSWANYPETLKSLNFNPNIKYGGGLGVSGINGKACYTRLLIKKRKVK